MRELYEECKVRNDILSEQFRKAKKVLATTGRGRGEVNRLRILLEDEVVKMDTALLAWAHGVKPVEAFFVDIIRDGYLPEGMVDELLEEAKCRQDRAILDAEAEVTEVVELSPMGMGAPETADDEGCPSWLKGVEDGG